MTDNVKKAYNIALDLFNERVTELEKELKVKNTIIILLLGVISFLLLR